MSGKYISREAARSEVLKWADGYSYIEIPTENATAQINAIPTADVVERPRWIPVTERLPENCADVLAYIERNAWGDGDVPHRKREIAIGYHVNGLWHVDGCSGVDCIAWMQLPEPPKEET